MTINDNLPEEIIEDILVKLPPKSILRFQSVSKSWFDLIKSSSFIHKHHVETKTRFLAMCCRNGPVGSKVRESRFLSVCLDDDQEEETSVTQLQKGVNRLIDVCHQAPVYNLPVLNFDPPSSYNIFPNAEKNRPWHLIGDCNGILCLTDCKDILLVNPSLKQVKKLPDPPRRCHLVGFGFDNLIMDFKVVRILTLPRKPNEVDQQQRAEVYTLKSNAWRKLDDLGFMFFSYSVIYPTFFNGVVYWCTTKKPSEPGIRTFYMANELFDLMEYPQGWDDRIEGIPCCFCLFVLNQESLAFLCNTQPCSSCDFVNVWTMNKHPNEGTWTKLYSIGPLSEYLKPMSFLKKDEFLYKTTTGKLILLDLHDHSSSIVCNDVSQLRSHDAFHQFDVCLELKVYKSSLFSINV